MIQKELFIFIIILKSQRKILLSLVKEILKNDIKGKRFNNF
jgi:hypothetical protein